MDNYNLDEGTFCSSCDYADECEDANMINFCENCKWFDSCTLSTCYCKGDHRVECNNGFELPYDEDDYEDEELDEDTIARLSGYIPYEDGGY